MSRPTPTRVILDAGSKILTYEQFYAKGYGQIVEYPDARVLSLSEEHGMVDLPVGSTKQPQVGDIVHIIPNHCCVVTNMVDSVVMMRKGQVEAPVPVAARGLIR
jgi:D-serine deaminase-like pyridoxal phosphate-dependent protein